MKDAAFLDCYFNYYLRPYCDTTLTNCYFAEGFILNATTDVRNITLVDCYLNNELITEDNVGELFEEGDTYTNSVVKISYTVDPAA